VSENREHSIAYNVKWRKEHADLRAAGRARWAAANPEKHAAGKIKWKRTHVAAVNAAHSRRRATKIQATPAWANEFFIEEAYHLAQLRTKATGFEWHVDHIVPLRSKLVCGLHVETNLQVIPAVKNLKKGNRHWPDMPESHNRSALNIPSN
jgi:hypothetical protein